MSRHGSTIGAPAPVSWTASATWTSRHPTRWPCMSSCNRPTWTQSTAPMSSPPRHLYRKRNGEHTWLVRFMLDGPLSDLSVLVQIPKVRRIAELLIDCRFVGIPDEIDSYGSQGTHCGHCREIADSVEQRDATPVEEVQASTLHCECCGLATATHRATLDCALCDKCVAMLVGMVKRTLEASG